MCINRKRQTEAGLLVEEGDDGGGRSQPVPVEKETDVILASGYLGLFIFTVQ